MGCLIDNVAGIIILLAIDTRGLGRIGAVRLLSSPGTRVVNSIGHHVTEAMLQIIRTTEDIVEGDILILRHVIN